MTRTLPLSLLAFASGVGATTFSVCFEDSLYVRLTIVDSNSAPLACIAAASEHGHTWGALSMALPLLVGVPVAGCMIPTREGATIIAPISPGVGRVWGAMAFVDGDTVLGHELAHIAGHRHPAWLPFVDLGCLNEQTH